MTVTLADVLGSADALDAGQLAPFAGFGGLHGGLAAAHMVRRMREQVPGPTELVSVWVSFLRPIIGPPSVSASVVSTGRTRTVVRSVLTSSVKDAVDAEAVFAGRRGPARLRPVTPRMPDGLVPRDEAEVFTVPPEFVPISTRTEIRPATPTLPFTGADEPVLTAWLKLTEPVADSTERLLILMDALAPSYAAVLTDPVEIPTVAMTAHIADAGSRPVDEWVLLRAETTVADTGGWLHETIDVWSEDRTHLARATQLRVVR